MINDHYTLQVMKERDMYFTISTVAAHLKLGIFRAISISALRHSS